MGNPDTDPRGRCEAMDAIDRAQVAIRDKVGSGHRDRYEVGRSMGLLAAAQQALSVGQTALATQLADWARVGAEMA